jgi:hypothetical protein
MGRKKGMKNKNVPWHTFTGTEACDKCGLDKAAHKGKVSASRSKFKEAMDMYKASKGSWVTSDKATRGKRPSRPKRGF